MKKDKIIILKDRGLISISGKDTEEFLQNIITNDIKKVSDINSIFSALLTPQGKYLCEFFVVKSKNGFFLDCDSSFTTELIDSLSKYKLRSEIKIDNLSNEYAVGIINSIKFKEIQEIENKNTSTILYRDSTIFIDPRKHELGARIISSLEKLHLTINKLDLKIIDTKFYIEQAYNLGIPISGIKNLKNQLFSLEANFEKLNAIDFKKGCYVGQENTARMKLKNKVRRKLVAIKSHSKIEVNSEILFDNKKIGQIIIGGTYPFALINLYQPNFEEFKDKEIFINNNKISIISC